MSSRRFTALGLVLLGLILAGGAGAAETPAPKPAPSSPAAGAMREPWRAITRIDYAALPIDEMPPDDGNVSPIAGEGFEPAPSTVKAVERVVETLSTWAPGHVADPVQRVRNYLILLGSADVAQSVLERFLPAAVLGHLLKEFPPEELPQILCYIAKHPDEGDMAAMKDPLVLSLSNPRLQPDEVRQRVYFYSVKLTRWVIGW